MPQTFDELYTLLTGPCEPIAIFGPLGDAATLKRRYRELLLIIHPDHNPARAAMANVAVTRLRDLFAVAQQQVAQGIYGMRPLISVTSSLHEYIGYEQPLPGDLCDLYPCMVESEPMLLKVTRLPRNNDLMAAEAQALQRIEMNLAGLAVRAHFPTLVESFLIRDSLHVQRQSNVLRREQGTYSLAEVLRAYPNGLLLADAAWMFKRLLAALANAHDMGLVHGAVTLAHVLICPTDHNGILIDWCYSVPIGTPLKAISRPYADDYPPEVPAKLPATPATDLYMASRCLVRLLGGSGDANTLPPSVPKAVQALMRSCQLASPQRRANDAWQLFDDFNELLQQLYGPPKFRPFVMPNNET